MNIDSIREEVDNIIYSIEVKKEARAASMASIKIYLEQLSNDHGIKSEKAAEKFIEDSKKELSDIHSRIESKYNILKEKIDA